MFPEMVAGGWVTVCATLRQPVSPAVQLTMLLDELIEQGTLVQLLGDLVAARSYANASGWIEV